MKMDACWSLCLFSIVASSFAFNVDQWPGYFMTPKLNFLQSPSEVNTGKDNETSPVYFGQSINLMPQGENGSFVLLVGSPFAGSNKTHASAETTSSFSSNGIGRINSYNIDSSLFGGESSNVTKSSFQDLTLGDGLGIAITATTDGNAVACAASRGLDCGNDIFAPGFCSNSTDYGRSWSEARRANDTRCPISHVDALFVLDGSHSVNGSWKTVKDWVLAITKRLDLQSGRVSVGVVEYSYYFNTEPIDKQTYIKTVIKIGQHKSFEEFKKVLDEVPLYAFDTATGRALQKVVFDFNSTNDFGKEYNKQVMILVTDGKATDKELIPEAAQNIRDMGITTYAVGVNQTGDSINMTEIEIIANGGTGQRERVIIVDSFDDLDAIVGDLRIEIQSGILEGNNEKTKGIFFSETGLSASYSKVGNSAGVSIVMSCA